MFSGLSIGSAFASSSRALLPVRKRSGRDELVLWGRREDEPGDSEMIPCVSINTIKNGEWEMYAPRWVKLFVERFQMTDEQGIAQWHTLPHGAFLQGVLIKDTDDHHTRRVYIACIDVPEELAGLSQNGQWPHISEPLVNVDITRRPAGDEATGEQQSGRDAEQDAPLA